MSGCSPAIATERWTRATSVPPRETTRDTLSWWKTLPEERREKQGHASAASNHERQSDLAARQPDRVKEMLAELAAWQREVNTNATRQPDKPDRW